VKYVYVFISFLFYFPATSQVGGSATYTFLKLTNSARVAALGGENISINDNDLNFVFHNPGLLNKAMDKNIVLNYVHYFAGINYAYAAYAHNTRKFGMIASGIHFVNYGSFIKANETGLVLGSFSASELAWNVFWAKPLFDSLITFGVNLKPVYSKLEMYHSFGLAFDAGINYVSGNGLFSASVVYKNIGSQIKPYVRGNFEPLPFDMQFGLSQKLEHAPFRLSATLHHLHIWDMTFDKSGNPAFTQVSNSFFTQAGYEFNVMDNLLRHSIFSMEFIPSKNFIVMVGYNHQRRKEMSVETKPSLVGFSWGFYIKLNKFSISYSQATYHLAGASNHFSISLNMGDFYKRNMD
jgi:hypothetical protein